MPVYLRGEVYWINKRTKLVPSGRIRRPVASIKALGKKAAKKAAEDALAILCARLASGTFNPADYEPKPVEPTGVTFDRVAELYVESKLANGKRADSYYWLRREDKSGEVIPGAWLTAFAGRPVASITAEEIETHLSAWAKERGLTPATRNRALSQMSGALSFAFRKGWLREHPIRFGRVERFREDNLRERWLRPHEIKALAAKAREDGREYLADVIEFAALTGKRLGEIVRIRRCDYTTDGGGNLALWIGKTKNGKPEMLPIEGEAVELVKRKAAACGSPSARLFPGPRGQSVQQAVARYFRKTVEAVAAEHPDWSLAYGRGKGQVSFHTLRASFATLGSAAGMSERDLMAAGNWKTRAMLDRYVRRDDDTLRAGLGRVGSVILGTFGDAERGHKVDTSADDTGAEANAS
jgi:integrase